MYCIAAGYQIFIIEDYRSQYKIVFQGERRQDIDGTLTVGIQVINFIQHNGKVDVRIRIGITSCIRAKEIDILEALSINQVEIVPDLLEKVS